MDKRGCEKLAQWYEGDWPEAAVSLREGMEEPGFTHQPPGCDAVAASLPGDDEHRRVS